MDDEIETGIKGIDLLVAECSRSLSGMRHADRTVVHIVGPIGKALCLDRSQGLPNPWALTTAQVRADHDFCTERDSWQGTDEGRRILDALKNLEGSQPRAATLLRLRKSEQR